jgi:cell wall-associated NlpC family hydrolase
MRMDQTKRLKASIAGWQGTPYVAGQSFPGKGGGVDCVRICDLILQDALGLSLDPLPRHSQDSAFHDKSVVANMQRLLFERFDLYSVPVDGQIQPLDLIVCSQKIKGMRTPADHEGHHIVLATSSNQCIDAWPGVGVRVLGMGSIRAGFEIHKVWRSEKVTTQ